MAPEKHPLSDRLLSRLKNRRVVAYLVVLSAALAGMANFGESIVRLSRFVSASLETGVVPVVLPKDTGWIFAGYFDDRLAIYTEGPYFSVVRSPYPSQDKLPRQGELLRITNKERNIIIADFETKGLTRRFDPPWQQNELKSSDYTGLKLPVGATVEVRDVSMGAYPDRPVAVWVRVGSPR